MLIDRNTQNQAIKVINGNGFGLDDICPIVVIVQMLLRPIKFPISFFSLGTLKFSDLVSKREKEKKTLIRSLSLIGCKCAMIFLSIKTE